MTDYTASTTIIGALGTNPSERGLTTQQFKDKFDQGLTAFVTWFNETHKADHDALPSTASPTYTGTASFENATFSGNVTLSAGTTLQAQLDEINHRNFMDV